MIPCVSYASPMEGYGSPSESATISQNQSTSFNIFSDKTNITVLDSGMDIEYDFSAVKKIMVFNPNVSEVEKSQDTELQNVLTDTFLKCAKVLKRNIFRQDQESISANIYVRSEIVQYQGASENKDMPTQVRAKFAAYDAKNKSTNHLPVLIL